MKPLEILNAVRNYQNTIARQDMLNNVAMDQNGWTGLAGALGKAFAGYQAGKAGRLANEQEMQIRQLEEQKRQEALQAEATKEQEARMQRYQIAKSNGLDDATARAVADNLVKLNDVLSRRHDASQAEIQRGFTAGENQKNRDNTRTLQEDRQSFEVSQKPPEKPDFSQGDDLRKEFQSSQIVKDFDKINASFKKVVNSAQNPNPATDIALITGFMKMNDPGSTVREGEFATAAEAGSANHRFLNIYNGLVNGQKLTPEQRAYFVDSSNRLYQAHVDQYTNISNQYRDLAQRQGMNPDDIFIQRNVMDIESQTQQQPTKTATNPETGERIGFINGQWVPIQ